MALVTAEAARVPRVARDLRELGLVKLGARAGLRWMRERVGYVALGARGVSSVRALIGLGQVVTARARLRRRHVWTVRRARVWLMTARAAVPLDARVRRCDRGVTTLAGGITDLCNLVRAMAVRADPMRRRALL